MRKKSIVLLSGGLDSVVNFKKALDETEVFLSLTFDYGQEALQREIESTHSISKKYGVPHRVIKLSYLAELDNGLTKGKIPQYDEQKLDDPEYAANTAKAVWVPNRNGLFINIAAVYADRYNVDYIITGFNKEEGATFPDNTPEFIEKINSALKYSTQSGTEVESYTISMDKTGIVKLGMQIEAPLEFVWSCYHGYSKMCGECESCRRLRRALEANHYLDEFNKQNRWGFR